MFIIDSAQVAPTRVRQVIGRLLIIHSSVRRRQGNVHQTSTTANNVRQRFASQGTRPTSTLIAGP